MIGKDPVDFWDMAGLFPKQVTFLKQARTRRYMLYGGARGGGKSRLLRWGLLERLLLWWTDGGAENVRVCLFSEDYPTLKDRQITKIKGEFPRWLGEVKSTQDEGLGFYLHDQWGGGAILLRNLDDPSKYQSAEFAGIAVEELTKNPIEVFDILRGSLRWPGISDTFFWGATNPGGIGHLWVKALWLDRDFTGDLERFAATADDFHFVQSLPKDNPHLDDSYWKELESLPPQLYAAWVLGDWDVFEGQAFSEWDRRVHVTEWKPEADKDRAYRWTAGSDWGYTAQGCMYLIATTGDRSLIRHEWLFKGLDPYEAGYQYGTFLRAWPKPEWISMDEPPVPDGGPTIIERFQAGLNAALPDERIPVVQPPRGRGSRLAKKQHMHEALAFDRAAVAPLLERDERIPGWLLPDLLIHASCKYLIRTLPALPLDERNNEDVATDGDDHGYDSIAGWLMSRIPQVERTREQPRHPDDHVKFRLEREPEQTSRWTREPV